MSHSMSSSSTGRLGGLDGRDLLTLVGFVVGVNVVGALPAVFSGADTSWIERPWFYPPELAFPIVWTLLFTLMGIALFVLWRAGFDRPDVKLAVGVFAAQMAVNVTWTPVFFGLQEPGWGLAIVVALWALIVATIYAFDRVDRRAAALLVPYLAWVSFAAVLNYEIWRLSG